MKPCCVLLGSIRFPHNCVTEGKQRLEMYSASGVCVEKLSMMLS